MATARAFPLWHKLPRSCSDRILEFLFADGSELLILREGRLRTDPLCTVDTLLPHIPIRQVANKHLQTQAISVLLRVKVLVWRLLDFHYWQIENLKIALGPCFSSIQRIAIRYDRSAAKILRSELSTDRHIRALSQFPRRVRVAALETKHNGHYFDNVGAVILHVFAQRRNLPYTSIVPSRIAGDKLEGLFWNKPGDEDKALAITRVTRQEFKYIRDWRHMTLQPPPSTSVLPLR